MKTVITLHSVGDGYVSMVIEQDDVIVRVDQVRLYTTESKTIRDEPALLVEFLDCHKAIVTGAVKDALERAVIGKHFNE